MISHSDSDASPPSMKRRLTGAGLDLALAPIAAGAVVVRKLVRALFIGLVWVLDLAFPILLQLLRIPLAAARLLGDGLALLVRLAIGCLPVGGDARERWRAMARERWSWIRERLSYRRFEEAVHSAFERGMAWVFRRCRHLSPNKAVLVIFAALLWIPISFGSATALHAFLIANAAALPPWAQLLHPLATIAAKSKLLVLPVYPAAWPQAKRHWIVRYSYSAWAYVAGLPASRRFVELYTALASAFDRAILVLWRAIPFAGPGQVFAVEEAPRTSPGAEPVSSRLRASLSRWSIKFTPEYYELRELQARD